MFNAIMRIKKRCAVINSGLSCVALILNLSNRKMKILQAKKAGQGCNTYDWSYNFILVEQYELIA